MLALGVLATGSYVHLCSHSEGASAIASRLTKKLRPRSSMGGVLYPSLVNKLIYTIGYGWAIRTGRFLDWVRAVLKAVSIADLHSLAVGFINVTLLAFACIVIDSRLPPRPIGRLSSFVDFKVFVGKENRGYMLYVVGAGVVWLGTCPFDFHSSMPEQSTLTHFPRALKASTRRSFTRAYQVARCFFSFDSH